jgi:dynein heavy chain
MGPQFIVPPSLDLECILRDSTPYTPIIFVLSPGSDPTSLLKSLADKVGQEVEDLSLGAGQDKPATLMLEKGIKNGNWVFFANCHLSMFKRSLQSQQQTQPQ